MAFCTNCGAKLINQANFCTKCGARVRKLVTPPIASPVAAPKPEGKKIHMRVHGTSYHEEEIQTLLIYTDEYSAKELKDLYDDYELIQFDHFKDDEVTLVPEPDNQYDPNAVKVIVCGRFVGYIAKNYCATCKRRLEAGKITRIEVEIIGGNCAKIYPTDAGGRHVERFYKQPYIMLDYWYNE